SDGDEEFLSLEGREVWPFPQTDDRAYAGHDLLADTPAALNQLATLRARGASFLVVPAPALWLLDRYREFKQQLETQFALVERLEDSGVIFDLRPTEEEHQRYRHWLHRFREVVHTRLPPEAAVIVLSEGDEELVRLEGREAWHFP